MSFEVCFKIDIIVIGANQSFERTKLVLRPHGSFKASVAFRYHCGSNSLFAHVVGLNFLAWLMGPAILAMVESHFGFFVGCVLCTVLRWPLDVLAMILEGGLWLVCWQHSPLMMDNLLFSQVEEHNAGLKTPPTEVTRRYYRIYLHNLHPFFRKFRASKGGAQIMGGFCEKVRNNV